MNFNFDNRFFRGLAKLMDLFLVSTLWLFMCIPVFTIGASSTALYYTVHKAVVHNRGYVWTTFWQAFRENFKQSTGMWLIQMIMFMVLSFDVYMTWENLKQGTTIGYMFYPFLVLFLLVLGWSLVLTGYTARFCNTNRGIMKNAALISILHIPSVLLILVLTIVSVLAVYMLWPMIFVMPAVLYWIMDSILERIFRKYMTPEDLAAEEAQDTLDEEA